MSTAICQDQFEFDYIPPRTRPTSKQNQCRHIWRSITFYHPDYSHISIDEFCCKRCGLAKDWQ